MQSATTKDINIYLEVKNMTQDEAGNPAPAGLKVTIGRSDENINYREMTKDLNIPAFLKWLKILPMVNPEDVTVITPEEYQERYGDEDE